MKIVAVILLLAGFLPPLEGFWKNFDISNIVPWAKKVPVSNYKAFIDLRLVKKDWLPDTETLPQGDKVIKDYLGPVNEAYTLFKNPDYTYAFTERQMTEGLELMTPEFGYDPALPSIFVIHTISEDGSKFFVRNTVTVSFAALALRNIVRNYNVFSLNMPDLQATMEQTVWYSLFGNKDSLYGFGKAIGSFIQDAVTKKLITLDQINIISFCFSSHVAAYIGRYLSHYNGKKISSILGMDPYSILFSSMDNQFLTSLDAQTVHIYHTNSLFFGTFRRRAHADFVINSGMYQPGCLKKSFFATMDCSHQRSVLILWYSILYPDMFVGRRCSNYIFFKMCLCSKNPVQTLSYPLNPETKGKYYLKTDSQKPYALGPPSAACRRR